jgi:peptide deformylase
MLTTPDIKLEPRRLLLWRYGVDYPGDGRVLTTPAAKVDVFNGKLRQLVVDMFHTMYAMNGIGLAAPQVGLGLQVAVVDISFGHDPRAKIVLVNPKIIELGQATQEEWEGCLSLPGFRSKVERADECWVEAQNDLGEPWDIEADGLLARALQHEIAHLNGKLYIDLISKPKRSMITGKIKKLKRQGRW